MNNKNISIQEIVLNRKTTGFDFNLEKEIDLIKNKGFQEIKFIYPFPSETKDYVSLIEVAPQLTKIKRYIQERGLKLVTGEIKNNPYLPDKSFLNIKKAKLEIDFKKISQKPKISVIIPTRNRKNSLKLVCNSLFNQNYPKSDYEIIIVDDGSDDETIRMIRKLKPTVNFKYFYWPRIKVNKKNKWSRFYNRAGLSRNIGVDNSEGEIILFNDSDIMVEKNCLRKHYQYHNKYSNIVVRGFRMFLSKESNDLKRAKSRKNKKEIDLHCRMHDLSEEGWQRIITANLSLRKKYLYEINGFDKNFSFWGSEDIDLGYRLSKLNLKFIWDSKIKVYHLWHSTCSDIDRLILFWVGENLLYRKYLDENILRIHTRDTILRHLDKLI